MAKRVFSSMNFTPASVADAAAFTDGAYMAIQGGASTQRVLISDIYLTGRAAASSPTPLALARDSTLGATLTGLATPNSDGPEDPKASALSAGPTAFIASTTKPQRSNSVSVAKMNFGFNAFGGLVRVNLPPGSEWVIYGNAATDGESSLSGLPSGSPGAIDASITYEPI